MARKRRSNERAFEREITPSVSKPSPATLTFSTMKAVAVNEPKKKVRLSRFERDQVRKFQVWPLVGDTRAVAVWPRMSDDERMVAQKLLLGVRRAA